MKIQIRKLTPDEIAEKDIYSWSIWTCDTSEFDWEYDERETCLILEGEVSVETDQGTFSFGPGDYVEFPKGLKCRWKVYKPVRKHYQFG